VSKGAAGVNVPREVGTTVDQARSDLAGAGLKPVVTRVPSNQPIDSVVAQSPPGGQAHKGSTVQLNVSDGPQTTTTTQSTTTVTLPPATTGTATSTTP
jgi:beta-lactam-binding protein with PASTA domain